MKISIISAVIGLCGTALSAPVTDNSIVERSSVAGLGLLGCGLNQQYSIILGRCIPKFGFGSGIISFGKGDSSSKDASDPAKRDEDKRWIGAEILPNLCPIGQKWSSLLMKCVRNGSFIGIVAGDKKTSDPTKRDEERRWIGAEILPNLCPAGQRWSSILMKCVRTGGFTGIVAGDKDASNPTKRDEEKRWLGAEILPNPCPIGQKWSSILMRCVRTGGFTGIVVGDKHTGSSIHDEEKKPE